MRDALKWQYLGVDGAKPFPANQNVKYECFHWASKYSILLAGSVYIGKLITIGAIDDKLFRNESNEVLSIFS